jgi:CheY-like chemotaxis protein
MRQGVAQEHARPDPAQYQLCGGVEACMRKSLLRVRRRSSLPCDGISRRNFLLLLAPAVAAPGALAASEALPTVRPSQNAFHPRPNPCLFAVDNEPAITELYRLVLEPAGYEVKTFNCRAAALAALLVAERLPELLITGYEGYPISAEEFMHACRQVKRDLKILMATGYPPDYLGPVAGQPDRFLQKPFSTECLLKEVRLLMGHSRA